MEILAFLAVGQQPAPPGFKDMLFPLVLVMIISYMLFLKPQQKQQRERDETQKKLKAGTRVITVGGLHGTITSVKESTVVLQVAEKTRITVNSSSISEIRDKTEEKSESADTNKKKK